MTARRGGGTCCDVNCLVLLASAVLALRLIATAPVLEPVPPPAPVGVYFCGPTRNGDLSNSYAAAWLATRGRFVKGVPLGMPFLKRFLSPGLMRRPGFNLSEHIDFRAVNMEGASYLMMRRASKNDRGALRTADAFDFYVEHLSAYERMVDLLSMEPAATRAAVVDAVVARLGAREARLRASFPRFLAPRPAGVAVMPFYGAAVATGHSTLELRELYLRLTLLSCARLFPNAAVAVATEADAARAAAAAESVAHVVDVEILRLDAAIAAPEQLGIATVAEIQRRFATGDWTRHAHVLYTEADQVVHARRVAALLGSLTDAGRNSLRAGKRVRSAFAVAPVTGPPNLTATAWPERPVEVVVDDEATARCCFVKARCAHFLQPARKDKRVGLVPDPNLALFVTAAQGGSDPMIAGNGDLSLMLIFHDAVNDSDEYRYILMLRVWHPELTDTERAALQFLFDVLDVPDLVSAAEAELAGLRTRPEERAKLAPGAAKPQKNKKGGKKKKKGKAAGFGVAL
ncbi:hypothetical protein JL720_11348 [Aureococcus anophagefferens]|nr:hypothetical protein JL720_11348 [Aureococcus anophagefferens]